MLPFHFGPSGLKSPLRSLSRITASCFAPFATGESQVALKPPRIHFTISYVELLCCQTARRTPSGQSAYTAGEPPPAPLTRCSRCPNRSDRIAKPTSVVACQATAVKPPSPLQTTRPRWPTRQSSRPVPGRSCHSCWPAASKSRRRL